MALCIKEERLFVVEFDGDMTNDQVTTAEILGGLIDVRGDNALAAFEHWDTASDYLSELAKLPQEQEPDEPAEKAAEPDAPAGLYTATTGESVFLSDTLDPPIAPESVPETEETDELDEEADDE